MKKNYFERDVKAEEAWRNTSKGQKRFIKILLGVIVFIPLLIVSTCVYNIATYTPSEPEPYKVRASAFDGSVHHVERFLKNNLKDPKSYEGIEWGNLVEQDMPGYSYTIWHQYRAKNSFGGYVVSKQMFYLDSLGSVVNVEDVNF